MVVLYILFLLLELAIIVFLVYQIWKNRNFTIKTTFAYPCLVILGLISIFIIKLKINLDVVWYRSLAEALSASIRLLTFELDGTIIESLRMAKEWLLLIDYLGLIVCSMCITFGFTVMFFRAVIFNFLRIKLFVNEVTYIIGLNDDAREYIKSMNPEKKKVSKERLSECKKLRAKHSLILKYENANNHHEDIMYLDKQHIKYQIIDYDKKWKYNIMLDRLFRSKNKKYNVIYFIDDDKELFDCVDWTKSYIEKHELINKPIQFIFSVNGSQKEFLTTYASENNGFGKDESLGHIRFVNKYDLISYDFIRKYPLSALIPKKYINDDCTISDDIEINLFMIGFGKVNQAMLRDTLINSQFARRITQEDGTSRLESYRMNVHIYDENKVIKSSDLSFGLLKYNKKNYGSNDYFGLPEDYASRIKYNLESNVHSPNFISKIYDEIHNSEKKTINFFFVSLGSDFVNANITNKINSVLNNIDDVFIFTRIKQIELTNKENIFMFGSDAILCYENMINSKIYHSAMIESSIYNRDNEESILVQWSKLSIIKQKSNLYAVASIPFKLSLLGIDINNVDFDLLNRKYIIEDYSIDKIIARRKGVLKISARDTIAFIEHERWNAFELSIGALPYKKSLVIKHGIKSENELYHGNIATYDGLVEYYNETGKDVIIYDYDLMDNCFKHLNIK